MRERWEESGRFRGKVLFNGSTLSFLLLPLTLEFFLSFDGLLKGIVFDASATANSEPVVERISGSVGSFHAGEERVGDGEGQGVGVLFHQQLLPFPHLHADVDVVRRYRLMGPGGYSFGCQDAIQHFVDECLAELDALEFFLGKQGIIMIAIGKTQCDDF